MQTVIHIKDGLWSNIAAIVFLLCIASGAAWLERHSHGSVSVFVWLFCAALVVGCYFPVSSIRSPKSHLLAIDGEDLLWRTRGKDGGALSEERLPVKSIRVLEFVVPQRVGVPKSRLYSMSELYIVTVHGSRHELPLDFFPGVHRKQIIAAIQGFVPDVQVVEKTNEDA